MRLQSTLRLLVLGFALGATGTILGQEPTFANIDYPGVTSTQAWGINPRGDIVGVYTSAGHDHGFLLSGGSFTTIDFPGATTSTEVSKISPRGDIVGDYTLANSTTIHGFLLSGGSFTTIDFPGAIRTDPFGINARGDIVGI